MLLNHLAEGSLEVKLPTIRTNEAEVGRVREEKESGERSQSARREEASQRRERVRSAEPSGRMRHEQLHAVVVRSGLGSQNVKRTSAYVSSEPPLAVEMWKKCTPLWREARCKINIEKTVQLTASHLFCQLNSNSKSAHHCGAKQISESKPRCRSTFGT